MKTIIINDIYSNLTQKTTYIAFLVYLGVGFLTGYKFNITVGEDLPVNGSYSVGFMIGLLSLIIILIATILAFSLLFKEKDANFGLIIYATPIKKKQFAFARFLSFYSFTVFGFFILITGYVTGLHIQVAFKLNPDFHLWYFLYPFLIFGVINALVVCSLLFFVAQKFSNKLLVAITGILLYMLYMISLMFSNAPFMAQALPQSLVVQRISALVDVFGLSGYFFEAKDFTNSQRIDQMVPFSNYLLYNRFIYMLCSLGLVYMGVRSFSFVPRNKKKLKKQDDSILKSIYINTQFKRVTSILNRKTKWQAIISLIKIDTIYIGKSIALFVVSLLLLFYIGIEMYNDIDKGIRLPQLYASSGLLAQTINNSFYFIGALVVVYFVNDIFWRSKESGFFIIENTTFYAKEKGISHIGSIILLIVFLTVILLLEAVVFQVIFKFPHIDWIAYFGVVVFNTFPLILFSLFLLFVNILSKNKSFALGISILCFLLFTTPISKSIIDNSLFRFLSGYKGSYSDFLGYGSYLISFGWRLVFGFSTLLTFYLIHGLIKPKGKRIYNFFSLILGLTLAAISSFFYAKDYIPIDKEVAITEKVMYEKNYRKYQNILQPTIKKVIANIDLYPNEQSYVVRGSYVIKNLQSQPIDSILINLPNDFNVTSLTYHYKNETVHVKESTSELFLKRPIQLQDSAHLEFKMYYKWEAVNGHNSFNTIVENGSFIRISRYFPQFGYNEDVEVENVQIREKHQLGKATSIKPLEAPKVKTEDFIDLEMNVSTPKNQIAIGTGELKKQWTNKSRNYYSYLAESIPFRFALSSAGYKIKHDTYKGIDIKVLHHPLHHKNVDHLIYNTKLTLAYCIENFGAYPFQSVTYAEVSSFTQGFAATAYPGTIFMTENMTFNSNLGSENNVDVVNELAGHEVAHFWWGNNQISPDYREGYAMLTESLAMYTEVMIYKKMHGKEKMMERVAIHQQIYDAENGFNKKTPLLKVTNQAYLSYSKGVIVFVELIDLIGEKQLNQALKNFLQKNKYPNAKPIATDLLYEILKVAEKKYHKKIKSLFWNV